MSTRLLIGFLVLLAFTACSTPAQLTKTSELKYPDGRKEKTTTKVTLPDNPNGPSKIQLDEHTSAEVSATYAPPKEDVVAKTTTRISVWAAVVCAILALAAGIAHRYLPIIPSQAPVGLGALAGILYVAPTIVDRYAFWFFGGLIAWIAWTIYSATHNSKLKNMPTSSTVS